MSDDKTFVDIRDLTVTFTGGRKPVRAVSGVNLKVKRGEVVALIGESGSGKSVTLRSILRLHNPSRSKLEGQILVGDQDVVQLSNSDLSDFRGKVASMIFQEPMTCLNPVITVGQQIAESVRLHLGLDQSSANARALRALEQVEIPAAQQRFHEYPHQLSGGMRQRVMIAMAMVCEPRLLIADEPTTALDVTIQAQILNLMSRLQKDTGMAMLFITHNLGVVEIGRAHV